jgi:Trk-type K+ transport system membrane component
MVEIPYYPFIFIMILGGVAFTLVLLMQTWRAYRGIEEPDYHE